MKKTSNAILCFINHLLLDKEFMDDFFKFKSEWEKDVSYFYHIGKHIIVRGNELQINYDF